LCDNGIYDNFGLSGRANGLFFVRFMDDILVLAPTRWKLRRAVQIVNATLAELGLEKHPDKTFVGRAAKGFDFLGYRLSPAGLSVAKQTRERCAERVARLQERERTGGASPGVLGQYVRKRSANPVTPLGVFGVGRAGRMG
jgi:hypothetical protein